MTINSRRILPYTMAVDFDTILDIGSGKSTEAAELWLNNGKNVTSVDVDPCRCIDEHNHTVIKSDLFEIPESKKYDAIYASHVMEHIQDTGRFLSKLKRLLKDNGILMIIVPPMKPNIVGGHVHLWNMGLLMYNLILSGFDVRNGRFAKIAYNIAAFVRKGKRDLPELNYNKHDMEKLKSFFPDDEMFKQGFNGDMEEWNWFSRSQYGTCKAL